MIYAKDSQKHSKGQLAQYQTLNIGRNISIILLVW